MMMSLYRFLLHLYPTGYRSVYAGEMSWVFQQRLKDIERLGSWERLSFAALEIAGLLRGAVLQRFRGSKWNSLRRFNMPLFRFPRATIFLMMAALAGLLAAIHMGATILRESGPFQPVAWYAVPGVFAGLFLMFFAVAALANAILYALKQSGSQRLNNIRPWQERSRTAR